MLHLCTITGKTTRRTQFYSTSSNLPILPQFRFPSTAILKLNKTPNLRTAGFSRSQISLLLTTGQWCERDKTLTSQKETYRGSQLRLINAYSRSRPSLCRVQFAACSLTGRYCRIFQRKLKNKMQKITIAHSKIENFDANTRF